MGFASVAMPPTYDEACRGGGGGGEGEIGSAGRNAYWSGSVSGGIFTVTFTENGNGLTDVQSPDGQSPDGQSPDGQSPDGLSPDGLSPEGSADKPPSYESIFT